MIEKAILQRHLTENEGKEVFEFYKVKFNENDLGYISFNVLVHLFGQRTLAKAFSTRRVYNEVCYNNQLYGNVCLYNRCLEIHNSLFETPIILHPEKKLKQINLKTDKIRSPRNRKNNNDNCAGAIQIKQ